MSFPRRGTMATAGLLATVVVALGCAGSSGQFVAVNVLTRDRVEKCDHCIVTIAQIPTAFATLGDDGRFYFEIDALLDEMALLSDTQRFLVFKVRDGNGRTMFESATYPSDSLEAWSRRSPDILVPLARPTSTEGLLDEPRELIEGEGPVRDG